VAAYGPHSIPGVLHADLWSESSYLPRTQTASELAQAQAEQLHARSEFEALSHQLASELRAQYVTAQQTAELLKIHREGLSPQSRSEFQAGLAAYQSNKQDFQAVLTAFLDVLHLDEDYWQNLAEYETAIARLEQMTGLALR